MGSRAYTLKSQLVYSQYFKKAQRIAPDSLIVSISLYAPDSFNGQFMREFNPPEPLFRAYKAGRLSFEEFSELYKQMVLENKDPDEVYEALKGKIICCWEDDANVCHRKVVLDWLAENKGKKYIGGEL